MNMHGVEYSMLLYFHSCGCIAIECTVLPLCTMLEIRVFTSFAFYAARTYTHSNMAIRRFFDRINCYIKFCCYGNKLFALYANININNACKKNTSVAPSSDNRALSSFRSQFIISVAVLYCSLFSSLHFMFCIV